MNNIELLRGVKSLVKDFLTDPLALADLDFDVSVEADAMPHYCRP